MTDRNVQLYRCIQYDFFDMIRYILYDIQLNFVIVEFKAGRIRQTRGPPVADHWSIRIASIAKRYTIYQLITWIFQRILWLQVLTYTCIIQQANEKCFIINSNKMPRRHYLEGGGRRVNKGCIFPRMYIYMCLNKAPVLCYILNSILWEHGLLVTRPSSGDLDAKDYFGAHLKGIPLHVFIKKNIA